MEKQLSTIEIRDRLGQHLLFNKSGGNLSPLSVDIINSIFSKAVTIVLSQGALNLTPLISSAYARRFSGDVLIGLPHRMFDTLYEKYTTTFFSLLWRESTSDFIYRRVIWAKGELDEEKDELQYLNIKTYPKFGLPQYKKAYDKDIRQILKSGNHNKPQIVCIPIRKAIPAGITGEKAVKYLDVSYRDANFEPELIILESINDRPYSLDGISQLIKNVLNLQKKLVLHFSWPYLRGLEEFLSQEFILHGDTTAVFHLGKRLCVELQKQMKKPPVFAAKQSLENDLWDTIYYPNPEKQLDFKIFVTPSANLPRHPNEDELQSCRGPSDDWVTSIRERIKFERILDPMVENILLFPPIIDSFLCPSEITIRSRLPVGPRFVPLLDYVSDKMSSESSVYGLYRGLSSEMQKCRDLSNQVLGLHTNFAVSKKTLLHLYILKKVQAGIDELRNRLDEKNAAPIKINLLILNLYPFLGSRRALLDSLVRLFESIGFAREKLDLPNIFKQGQDYALSIRGDIKFVFEQASSHRFNIEDVAQSITRRPIPITASFLQQKDDQSDIVIALDLGSEFFEFDQSNNKSVVRETFLSPLVVYSARVLSNGHFEEFSLQNVNIKETQHLNRLRVEFDVSLKTPAISRKQKIELEISYVELEHIKNLSRDEILKTQLLIPGAIPFHTITDDKIMICEHFDSLLLPFKEIVFFAYPGNNLKRLLRQIRSYLALFSTHANRISNIDLQFSLKHTEKLTKVVAPLPPAAAEDFEYQIQGDTAIDIAIRQDLIDQAFTDEEEQSEIITLKQIWDKIRQKPSESEAWNYDGSSISAKIEREQVYLCVEYDDGSSESISFDGGTLLRKKMETGFEIYSIEEVCPGDSILYIQATERESVDNFLLRDYAIQKDIQLEQILEPIICLKLFYEAGKAVTVADFPKIESLDSLYWLDNAQKSRLFNTLQFLQKTRYLLEVELTLPETSDIEDALRENFWASFLGMDELIDIFDQGFPELTYSKLYAIAAKAGIDLAKDSFSALCSTALQEQKHYFFRDNEDLLALGKLMGHEELIDNYYARNELGKKLGTTLQIIGRCVARVASGRSDPYNEMDCSIENKLRIGTVRRVSFSA